MERFLQTSGALYDQTRIKILRFLLEQGPSCVCELQSSLDLGQSRLSRHLKILKDAGFLTNKREGKWIYYDLSRELDPFQQCALEVIKQLPIDLPNKSKECSI
ncbi:MULTISPECIES: helix-turn-helix transcriptional regulator [unclassified Nitratiruptor]|uniref:ArsR/SmtB family transcription factor n=1 Tax=unclassified Nitratiruptor TaxID=2624044 RepID=UPI00191671AF|nr:MULTISPECIES: metalloregulator ArsR/SmtB family transcription factor [unclassified Nitratiruptor]BCD59299.1 ArsR family transcriptional regulator, arsenate/arsenite/antimonite-responsive transcriptional repressor [Nitratiruptor sp. YY08-10]BCD63223.1 ArsR family transcriptional regulator, arsenate/arsenite/antimonite-responsive transcriptional repressor [Nitratiruptor sp. YY08-14]